MDVTRQIPCGIQHNQRANARDQQCKRKAEAINIKAEVDTQTWHPFPDKAQRIAGSDDGYHLGKPDKKTARNCDRN